MLGHPVARVPQSFRVLREGDARPEAVGGGLAFSERRQVEDGEGSGHRRLVLEGMRAGNDVAGPANRPRHAEDYDLGSPGGLISEESMPSESRPQKVSSSV